MYVMDADVSILTSVAIDHVDWLGDDRESIGYEKAGIFRRGKTVFCGDVSPPASVVQHAQQLQCDFKQAGRDYAVINPANNDEPAHDSWHLKSCFGDMKALPMPALAGEFQKNNAATAIVAMQYLQESQQLQPGHDWGLKMELNDTHN